MISSSLFGSSGQRQAKFGSQLLTLAVVALICIVGSATASGGRVGSFGVGSRSRTLTKRSFSDIQCKGVYDKSLFSKLDRVCDDCFNLYQETQLYTLCRSNCFGSTYFKGCLDALLLNEEEEKYDEMIEILGKK